MESQFRRGILDACVLAVLERGESYGYQMVKDMRTGCETGNTAAVLDGDLDQFIEAYLRFMK